MPGSRRRQRRGSEVTEPAETRERLLRSAATLFAWHGFDGASTRDIALRADVNQALLRYHFGGKEALWREVLEQGFAAFAQSLQAAGADQPAQRVPAMLAALGQHTELVQLLIHALLEPGSRRDWLLQERIAPWHARAAAWLGIDSSAEAPIVLWMWFAAAGTPAAFGAALEVLGGAALDRQATLRAQHDLLAPWLRGTADRPSAGAWSLAAAARRRVRGAG